MAPLLHPREDPHRMLGIFKEFDEALYATWGDALERAIEPDEVDVKNRAVLKVSLDSIVKWSIDVIEDDVNDAFEAGANITEMVEVIVHVGLNEGASHGMRHGLQGLKQAIVAREAKGLPCPLRGAGLTPEDMIREAPWPIPAAFPYQFPNPRYHNATLKEYCPEMSEAFETFIRARFDLRKELTRRMQELSVVANDVAILYASPTAIQTDHHVHAAFETGATAQELLEVVVIAATVVQGCHANNPLATIEGGWPALHHGVTSVERVLREREAAGIWAPRDKNSPRVGKAAVTL